MVFPLFLFVYSIDFRLHFYNEKWYFRNYFLTLFKKSWVNGDVVKLILYLNISTVQHLIPFGKSYYIYFVLHFHSLKSLLYNFIYVCIYVTIHLVWFCFFFSFSLSFIALCSLFIFLFFKKIFNKRKGEVFLEVKMKWILVFPMPV